MLNMQATNNMSLHCVRCQELAKLKFLMEPSLSFHGVRRLTGGVTASHGGIVNVHQDAEELIEKAKAKLTSRKKRKPTTNDTSQKVTFFHISLSETKKEKAFQYKNLIYS